MVADTSERGFRKSSSRSMSMSPSSSFGEMAITGRQIDGEQPVNTLRSYWEATVSYRGLSAEPPGSVRGISRGNLLQQAQGRRNSQQSAGAPGQEGRIGQARSKGVFNDGEGVDAFCLLGYFVIDGGEFCLKSAAASRVSVNKMGSGICSFDPGDGKDEFISKQSFQTENHGLLIPRYVVLDFNRPFSEFQASVSLGLSAMASSSCLEKEFTRGPPRWGRHRK